MLYCEKKRNEYTWGQQGKVSFNQLPWKYAALLAKGKIPLLVRRKIYDHLAKKKAE